MAAASNRPSSTTTLAFGLVEADVALFKTTADTKKVEDFDTAGPNGGTLRYDQRAKEVPVEQQDEAAVTPVRSDPLAEDPGPEAVPPPDTGPQPGRDGSVATTTPGEFRQVLVEEGSGVEVEPDEVRRGVRLADGSFVDLTEQLADVEDRTRLDEMRIVKFVDVGQAPRERVTGSYYLGANGPGVPKSLRALYEAMRRTRRVAVVKWTKRSRQSGGLIVPFPKGRTLLVLETAWAEDWREAPPRATALMTAEVTDAEVEATCEFIEAMSDTREALDELYDDAVVLRRELREAAEAGKADAFKVVQPPKVEQGEEPDLMGLLSRSVEQQHAA